MTEPYGDKRSSLIAAGKVRHKVAVIGTELFGQLTPDQIELGTADLSFFADQQRREMEELYNYSLVIVDFEGVVGNQEFFAKRMFEALEKGTNFCFVHYSHEGTQNRVLSTGDPHVGGLYKRQIGLQAIFDKGIQSLKADAAFRSGTVRVNEFKSFLDKYGASYNFFNCQNGFDLQIYTTGENNVTLGFAIDSGSGKIIVLPFMRDFTRLSSVKAGLTLLIDSLLTFITDSLIEMPDWATDTPFFQDEQPLFVRRLELQQELARVSESLGAFKEAKALLLQRKYTLENSVPRFLTENLGIPTERDEKYKEDFWVLDSSGSKAAIGEVTSLMKGLKESTIYSVVTHRDDYDLDLTFPALLVVNCNLQAGSWANKDQMLDVNDCKFAANKNVLVIRIEDLLRLWDAKRLGKLVTSEINRLLLTNTGWLRVSSNLEVEILPGPKTVAQRGDQKRTTTTA